MDGFLFRRVRHFVFGRDSTPGTPLREWPSPLIGRNPLPTMRPARVAAERSDSPNLTGGGLQPPSCAGACCKNQHERAFLWNGRWNGSRKRLLRIKKESKVDCPADSFLPTLAIASY